MIKINLVSVNPLFAVVTGNSIENNALRQYFGGVSTSFKNGVVVLLTGESVEYLVEKMPHARDKIKDNFNQQALFRNPNPPKYIKTEMGDVKLRDYQIKIMEKALSLNSFGNFSEQRTGKTLTTIMTLENLDKHKKIIIAPASVVLGEWIPQIRMVNKTSKIYKMFNTKTNKKGVVWEAPQSAKERVNTYKEFLNDTNDCYLVVSKDTWRSDSTSILPLLAKHYDNLALVVDEGTFLSKFRSTKTYGSKQVEAIMKLRDMVSYAILLTGTPTHSHDSEYYGLFRFLFPDVFKSYYNFIDYFWGTYNMIGNPIKEYYTDERNGISDKRESLRAIKNRFTDRVEQKEVMKWLEPITYTTIKGQMGKKQAIEYADTLEYYRNSNGFVSTLLTQVTELRIISNVFKDYETGKVYSWKFDWIYDFISGEEQKNVLVFSNYTGKTIDILHDYIIDLGVPKGYLLHKITGSVSMSERQKIIDTIQTDTKHKHILLANIETIQTGVKLDAIDVEIFLDWSFRTDYNSQAIQRFTPTSEERVKPKECIDLISLNPVVNYTGSALTDENIKEMLDKRIDIIKYLKENEYNIKEVE